MTGYARGEADFAAERYARDARPASLAPKDYSVPLHVDCSIEYELPDCAKPPQGVKIEPLLMIHPSHFRRLESLRRVPFVNNLPRGEGGVAGAAAAVTVTAAAPGERGRARRRCCRAVAAPAAGLPAPALPPPAPVAAQRSRSPERYLDSLAAEALALAAGKARGARLKAHPYACESRLAVGLPPERWDARPLRQLPIYM